MRVAAAASRRAGLVKPQRLRGMEPGGARGRCTRSPWLLVAQGLGDQPWVLLVPESHSLMETNGDTWCPGFSPAHCHEVNFLASDVYLNALTQTDLLLDSKSCDSLLISWPHASKCLGSRPRDWDVHALERMIAWTGSF